MIDAYASCTDSGPYRAATLVVLCAGRRGVRRFHRPDPSHRHDPPLHRVCDLVCQVVLPGHHQVTATDQ